AFIDQKLQAASSLTTTLSACTTVKIIISGRKVTIDANAVNRISFVDTLYLRSPARPVGKVSTQANSRTSRLTEFKEREDIGEYEKH
ncbi:MAG: hypothetical protein ACTHMT_11985, partial [Verrucomicrobiota bacterium]